MSTGSPSGIFIPDHSMPSDYSDVHPKSYDPEYISHISSQMQVPDRISVNSPQEHSPTDPNRTKGFMYNGMTVPDRILVAAHKKMKREHCQSPTIRLKSPDFILGKGEDSENSYEEFTQSYESDNQHIGVKSDLALHLQHEGPVNSEAMSYVGLLTPPRTLTTEEAFPMVDEQPKKEMESRLAPQSKTVNGHLVPTPPYDPGVNPDDSLLLNEEDELTLLRTQVSKLARRVEVVEDEHKKRAQREYVLYPFVFGYILWKVLGWLARDSRY